MDLEDLPFYIPSTPTKQDEPEGNNPENDDNRSDSTESVDGSPTRGKSLLPIESAVNTNGREMNNADGSFVIVSPTADGLAVQSCIGSETGIAGPIGDVIQAIDHSSVRDPHTSSYESDRSGNHDETIRQSASIDRIDANTGDFVPFIPFISSLFETKGGQDFLSALGMMVQWIGWTTVRTVWIVLIVWRVLCVVVLHSATALHWRLCIIGDFISSLYKHAEEREAVNMEHQAVVPASTSSSSSSTSASGPS
jgi:hypothetical protein